MPWHSISPSIFPSGSMMKGKNNKRIRDGIELFKRLGKQLTGSTGKVNTKK